MSNLREIFANELAYSSMVYMRLLHKQRSVDKFNEFFATMETTIAESLVDTVKRAMVRELVRKGDTQPVALNRVRNDLASVNINRDICPAARAKFAKCLTLIPRVEEVYSFNDHENQLICDFTRFVIEHLRKGSRELTVENFNNVLDTGFNTAYICKVYEKTFRDILLKTNRFTPDEIETAYRIILCDHVETGSEGLANGFISATKKFFAKNRNELIKI